ncbi:hypothetical protein VIGAN_04251400 [Vigna angularis var. angularis]|uniref:Uncharacterized protein n=1 Tax=Vigna angularis var. angularis TaxID=157739 RepID=A0A0S3RX67_PHAAN|nr:hypothetical protein VIGAN_04251400 [Vigna angularis var. angularis]
MFQKFALAFKTKTFEFFSDENASPLDDIDGFSLLDSTPKRSSLTKKSSSSSPTPIPPTIFLCCRALRFHNPRQNLKIRRRDLHLYNPRWNLEPPRRISLLRPPNLPSPKRRRR